MRETACRCRQAIARRATMRVLERLRYLREKQEMLMVYIDLADVSFKRGQRMFTPESG
jgi:hypothetical protein